VFIDNLGDVGSAMYSDSDVVLDRVMFDNNSAGGIYAFGGTLFLTGGTATLTDVVFTGNITTGGNANTYGVLLLGNCPASTLTRVTLIGNESPYAPAVAFSGCSPTVTNCTVYGNYTYPYSAVMCMDGASPILERTIIASNTGGPAFDCGDGHPVLDCCDILGNEGGDWVGCIEDQLGINGNISANPLFCDPGNGDLTLDCNSPCLPGNHPDGVDCGTIGAHGMGCGATSVEETTWGRIKAGYR
jgi:hypothetical protein